MERMIVPKFETEAEEAKGGSIIKAPWIGSSRSPLRRDGSVVARWRAGCMRRS
jgi:hypothetical protein